MHVLPPACLLFCCRVQTRTALVLLGWAPLGDVGSWPRPTQGRAQLHYGRLLVPDLAAWLAQAASFAAALPGADGRVTYLWDSMSRWHCAVPQVHCLRSCL